MSKVYFSKSARGFYFDEVHGEALPHDVVEIEPEEHADLMAAQADGKFIDWSGDRPVAIAMPASLLWAALQNRARTALDESDRVAVRCMKTGLGYPAAWRAYDDALRAIVRAAEGDPAQGLPPRPEYPPGT